MIEYDEKVFAALKQQQYRECEQYLSDFCFEMIHVPNEEQVIILKMFFISIINDIIKIKIRKKRLHPHNLAYAYGIISTIEKWENISEVLLSIPTYVEHVRNDILKTGILMEGNEHIEQALTIIHNNLTGDTLSVNWLATQLNISTTHLSNLFKIQFDETPSNYIMKRKMDEIIYELTYTNHSLKAIKAKYGFKNQSHFIKCFKKFQGVTPLQFMKQLHKRVEYVQKNQNIPTKIPEKD